MEESALGREEYPGNGWEELSFGDLRSVVGVVNGQAGDEIDMHTSASQILNDVGVEDATSSPSLGASEYAESFEMTLACSDVDVNGDDGLIVDDGDLLGWPECSSTTVINQAWDHPRKDFGNVYSCDSSTLVRYETNVHRATGTPGWEYVFARPLLFPL